MPSSRKTLTAALVAGVAVAAIVMLARRQPRAFPLQRDVTIPFEYFSKHIFLPVVVNGRPLSFVLDTGDKYAVIDLGRARELGLALGRTVDVAGIGATREQGAFLESATFKLAGLPGFSQPLSLAIPLTRMAPQLGHDFDGILGTDFINEFVLAIDYQARTLTLRDAATFSYTGAGTRVPIRLSRQGHPVVEGSVTPIGGAPIAARFVLDIGSGGSLTLFSPFVTAHGLPGAGVKTIPFVGGGGTGGDTTGQIGRVAELRLGDVAIARPIVDFSADTAGNFAGTAENGNVGADLLRRFRLILDYRRSQIVFERTAESAAPFDRGFSGLRVQSEGPAHRVLRVKDVLNGSPAAAAGVRPGDRVVAVDGRTGESLTLSAMLESLERVEAHHLALERDGRTLMITLTPRAIDNASSRP